MATLDSKDYDLHESIRRVMIGRMSDIEKKTIQLHLEFTEEPCFVYADQARIEQVILNIADNAIKFLNNGGNLTIRTSIVHDIVTVFVMNDGPPILPEDHRMCLSASINRTKRIPLARIPARTWAEHQQAHYGDARTKHPACSDANLEPPFEFTLRKGNSPAETELPKR